MNKSDDAIKLMQAKITNSVVLSGKQTAFHYEIKYYLKYLQFILAMSNSKNQLNHLLLLK